MYADDELRAFGWEPYALGQKVDVVIVQADHPKYAGLSADDLPGLSLLGERRVTDPRRFTGVPRLTVGGGEPTPRMSVEQLASFGRHRLAIIQRPGHHPRSSSRSGGGAEPRKRDIVASPCAEIPLRLRTFPMVLRMMAKSPDNDQESTYATSSRRRSSHEMAFRPQTWANPVRPGRKSCLRACSE